MKRNILYSIALIGVIAISAVLIMISYQQRGVVAVGGEVLLIPTLFAYVIYKWQSGSRESQDSLKESYSRYKQMREKLIIENDRYHTKEDVTITYLSAKSYRRLLSELRTSEESATG